MPTDYERFRIDNLRAPTEPVAFVNGQRLLIEIDGIASTAKADLRDRGRPDHRRDSLADRLVLASGCRLPGRSVYPRSAMSTCVVTGGAGFLGSHLCERLLGAGHRVICLDNLDTGTSRTSSIRHPEFEFQEPRRNPVRRGRRAGRLRPTTSRLAGEPDRLRAAPPPHPQGRLPGHLPDAGAGEVQAGPVPARLNLGGLRRPEIHPQSEDYWGNVNPIGPRGVYDEAKRYAEALTMAYHRQQGVNTCIARIFNSFGPKMRPHDGRAIPTFLRRRSRTSP